MHNQEGILVTETIDNLIIRIKKIASAFKSQLSSLFRDKPAFAITNIPCYYKPNLTLLGGVHDDQPLLPGPGYHRQLLTGGSFYEC